ncbi:MAG: bifunctional diaminohydroxyphosphoribosylaminopyrimidine deaminase/5-amino-6-(5-phosphoribosylamino)uracil reductase RibD [Roseibium sp.]|uniref:bifunctional diaminohydroxyphosphoribosylaminopyrimidine deaminase/5-amino-6-(5-phosphoribosylamino)uracil reductase RibD n=1 Tax=Roseibium sp. TaxID=1936156 RepID=UPI002630BD21|nr:bifunctional diaminohydroxyphosphoribosylaminopyrimidine deaminase/5-amino-6-(5-phosphoribosylamino)uracil reductase RibD [Roseibium sp.]MCV0424850.1 bifunctional diaminohydroxyphosphoribosylaminopyrimidine deaminase/5-amino-6-(5-phosphoribosylamino)uracil reductase RibD [Roseibium sp.]
MSANSNLDERFMAAAERMARRGLGRVWPNPAVAALIVREDEDGSVLVGRGVTSRPGMAHAEVNALRQAGDQARGATCYVTLEPCSHYGRTPPCALALTEAGVKRVVVGMLDPNPRVAGRGVQMLRDAGIDVVVGVRERQMQAIYHGFMLRQLRQRPHVFLKLAVSQDGFIGRSGEGQVKISGPLSMRKVHGFRAEHDAILVGTGTALADDPQLTCRLPGLASRSPVRVIIDRCARLPLESKLVRTCVDVPVWLICGNDADQDKIDLLSAAGVNVIRVPADECSIKPSVVLSALATRGVTRVMVEGGARMASSFLAADLVDDLCVVTGDIEIGKDGIPALHDFDLADVLEDPKFERIDAGKFGVDSFIYLRRRGA